MTIFSLFVTLVAQILTLAIFARAILSWFPMSPSGPLITILYQLTEPILAPLRRIIPSFGMIDISPLVAILLLQAIQQLANVGLF